VGSGAGFPPLGCEPAREDIVKRDDVFMIQPLKRFDFIQSSCAHSFFQSPQLYALHCDDAACCLHKED
jgi:hypothetical protein